MALFYYKYNNYNNRRLKKEETLTAYAPYLVYSELQTNFNKADGVTMQVTVGRDGNAYASNADYVIYSKDGLTIDSRWYIVESHYNRGGQFICVLHRDIIADFKDDILNAPAFIEKAILPSNSVFTLNQEPIATNQIKVKEQPLYDETGCAWIVGYIDRKYAADVDQKQLRFTINAAPRFDYTKETWPFFQSYGTFVKGHYTSRILLNHDMTSIQRQITTKYEKLYWDWTEYSQAVIDEGLKQSGLIIKDGTKYYKVKAELQTIKKYPTIKVDKEGIYLYTYYTQEFGQESAFTLMYELPQVKLSLYEIPQTVNLDVYIAGKTESETVGINDLRPGLTDAPYDMFCMPYMDGTLTLKQPTGDVTINITKEMSVAIAQSIALELGSANIYDLQLLPYCPLAGFTKTANGLTIDRFRHLDNIVSTQASPYSYYQCLFWCQQSHGTKNIILDEMPSYTNRKISNQCDMYRIVSPNYQGQFEFNLAQNNTATLPYFNVDYTYMPYNPYVHVNPYFSGLFGNDYNDARGLVCGGDYSIAYLSDAWKTYQINNKNYQNIFDRQIQNMSTNYKIESKEAGITGLITSLGAGTGAGLMIGGPMGALVGAGVGTAGIVAGAADMQLAYDKYAESRGYAVDTFKYQLDNIKALPYSLAKSTVINENNKNVPILETYSCTDEEKDAVANNICYRSMTLGIIDKISNYVNNTWTYKDMTDKGYIKGQIIRLEGDNIDDAHLSAAIFDEINKGWYFK